MGKTNWFWAHRRNTSLHHMSLFVRGLHGRGFLPTVNFFFDNQLYVGKPGKGVYIFYDRDQMDEKYKDIQQSIDTNPDFSADFKKKSDKLFTNLLNVCKKITANTDLPHLFKEFKTSITAGPIITVQLWGIEACWANDYVLVKEIGERLTPLRKGELSQSTGESVAFSERNSFLNILKEVQSAGLTTLAEPIPTEIKKLIENHIEEFSWIHSEYVSEPLPLSTWYKSFENELELNAKKELKKLHDDRGKALQQKKHLMERLHLSEHALHTLDALNEFVSERDWAKGKFCRALAVYDTLLERAASQLNVEKEDVLYYDIDELITALETDQHLDVSKRKQAFVIVSREGNISILSGSDVDTLIDSEGIGDTFSRVEKVETFQGIIVNPGKVEGTVRVIDNPKEIDTFQKGEILVTYMTTMEFTPLFKKAAGIITDEGGLSSHAAIISREFGVPCVVGTKIATRTLQTGDTVILNAETGTVTLT